MGGGGGNPVGMWYKANGPTANMPRSRCDNESNRWETVVNGFMDIGFEVVVYFQIPPGMPSGGHIGLKMGGPNHGSDCQHKQSGPCGGSGCCCWWDGGLRRNGNVYLEVEGPHPSNCKGKNFGNAGRSLDSNRPFGVRWHIMREGGGMRLMQWVDTSGGTNNNWKPTYNVLDTGQFMIQSYFGQITKSQNIEIRISDAKCSSIKMLVGPIARKIGGGGSAATSIPNNGGWTDQFGLIRHNQYFS